MPAMKLQHTCCRPSCEEPGAEGVTAGSGLAATAGGATSAALVGAGATGLRGACPRSPLKKDHCCVHGVGHHETETSKVKMASLKRDQLCTSASTALA